MDQNYWESQYQAGTLGWDKGEAAPGLVDFISRKPLPGASTICVPGCGRGHDVRAWASLGYPRVTGLDIASQAVTQARQLITPATATARFIHADFLEMKPAEPFDVVFEHTLYCAIHPRNRDLYAAAVRRWLKPGGSFLAIHYCIRDQDGPPFGTDRGEVWKRFSPVLTVA